MYKSMTLLAASLLVVGLSAQAQTTTDRKAAGAATQGGSVTAESPPSTARPTENTRAGVKAARTNDGSESAEPKPTGSGKIDSSTSRTAVKQSRTNDGSGTAEKPNPAPAGKPLHLRKKAAAAAQ